jgi:hypothetical protein
VVGQRDEVCPAQQVVREGGDHRPGRVGVERGGREVRQRLGFEVADRELDDGVLAVLSLDRLDRVGAVGRERVCPVTDESQVMRASRVGRGRLAVQSLMVWLKRLNAAGAIDRSAVVVDGSHIRALQGGPYRAIPR